MQKLSSYRLLAMVDFSAEDIKSYLIDLRLLSVMLRKHKSTPDLNAWKLFSVALKAKLKMDVIDPDYIKKWYSCFASWR